jgi:AraC-like DNA-binding protein
MLIRSAKPFAKAAPAALGALIAAILAHGSGAQVVAQDEGAKLLQLISGAALDGFQVKLRERNLKRLRALDQALAAMRAPPDMLTVANLCRVTGASARALRTAFMERYSIPPSRFLKAYRLNGVREDLRLLAAPGIRIAEVAKKWGFWHLGQFASDYRSWFEELPSETLRRKLGVVAGGGDQ